MNLFPLSGHSGNRGVSIMITFESKIWNMELTTRSNILPYKSDQFQLKEISRKRRKWHRRKSPQGGWGMGSKEPIKRMILLQQLQYQSTDKTDISWSLYRLKPIYYSLCKKITNYVTKERPLGGFERSKSHFGQQIIFFSYIPAKLK